MSDVFNFFFKWKQELSNPTLHNYTEKVSRSGFLCPLLWSELQRIESSWLCSRSTKPDEAPILFNEIFSSFSWFKQLRKFCVQMKPTINETFLWNETNPQFIQSFSSPRGFARCFPEQYCFSFGTSLRYLAVTYQRVSYLYCTCSLERKCCQKQLNTVKNMIIRENNFFCLKFSPLQRLFLH